MTVGATEPAIVFLPGAGAEKAPEIAAQFRRRGQFEEIPYPDWRTYVSRGYTGARLADDLTTAITARVPEGPIRILGFSLGGHFGYACALRLLERGRDVAGLCAIDAYGIDSTDAQSGWVRRNFDHLSDIARSQGAVAVAGAVRSLGWRAGLRLGGERVSAMLRRKSSSRAWARAISADPRLEAELNMRLLLRIAVPFLRELDAAPSVLQVPTVLLRASVEHDDSIWWKRCTDVKAVPIAGTHDTLLWPQNADTLRSEMVAATGWHKT